MGGRKADLVVLRGEERSFPRSSGPTPQSAAFTIVSLPDVLLCGDALQSKDVAERFGVHEHTVGKWQRLFAQSGIEGLTDEYRAGRLVRYRMNRWLR